MRGSNFVARLPNVLTYFWLLVFIKCFLHSPLDSDQDGKTALLLAAQNGNKKVCSLLVDQGADLNLSNQVNPLGTTCSPVNLQ